MFVCIHTYRYLMNECAVSDWNQASVPNIKNGRISHAQVIASHFIFMAFSVFSVRVYSVVVLYCGVF